LPRGIRNWRAIVVIDVAVVSTRRRDRHVQRLRALPTIEFERVAATRSRAKLRSASAASTAGQGCEVRQDSQGPLMRIEHNGTYAVVASKRRRPTQPFWYRDIVANPLVELQDGAVKQEMRAREVFGGEKDEW
jgi:F420H(2)-dependent quinone reductase